MESICSWEFHGEFDVWICGIKVPLKFVDLIFPGGTVDITNIPEPPLDKVAFFTWSFNTKDN